MPTLFAVMSTCLLEEPATQLQEIQDTKHAFLVRTYVVFSSAPVVIVIRARPLSYLRLLWLSLLLLQKILEDNTYYSSEQTAELSVGIADS